ncbi:ATP-grasp domain-containing protein [Lacticaseibacillus pantheris]|uniref:ATP-grasp domain-containing protein n=1 Tax=Lacticaseibacillus pantheris TaxID=171523 RepID=UPI0026582AC3|nr:ATP-grasp domain-containing protein [Lacticaseibacillus pantheris]WKF84785.1 ATP-grasp domain-containing protein [Lacticaseibacillus pantheris]
MNNFIEPGATVGIIGGGAAALQLVRAAHNLGMHAAVLARTNGDAALTEAEFPLVGRSTDVDALQQLRDLSSVITYIDESVADATTIDDLVPADKVPGGTDFLAMTQDRYLEKVFLEDLNMNVLPYAQVVTADDIDKAVNAVGFPSILKPIQKGIGQDQQLALTNDADIWRAKGLLEKRPYIVEAWLDQPREFAITAIRTADGMQVLPAVENKVAQHELQYTILPAQVDSTVADEMERITRKVGEQITQIGLFTVEFFLTNEGNLYVKRLSPGPHQSADVYTTATTTSQYTLHMRAVCGWPVAEVRVMDGAVMKPLRPEQLGAVSVQIQIKPDWHWRFFPEGSHLYGELTVLGAPAKVIEALNATGDLALDMTAAE